MDRVALGENHPSTATDWNNLGSAWKAKGEYDKAIGYYEKSLAIFTQRLGKTHPNTRTVQENLDILKSKIKKL